MNQKFWLVIGAATVIAFTFWLAYPQSLDLIESLWDLMGFRGKTLWDWMNLLIIPAMLAGGAVLLNRVQRQRELDIAEKERETEREIATDRSKEAALQSYLDRMTDLLRKELGDREPDDKVKAVARTLTLTTLRRLDEPRKGILLRFLYEADLIYKDKRVIDLSEADLTGVNLFRVDLRGVNLSGANLSGANLMSADLSGAILKEAELNEADLIQTNLSGADLTKAHLGGVSLLLTRIDETTQIDAKWRLVWEIINHDIEGRDLRGADLYEANLSNVNLTGANLSRANLTNASLRGAKLNGAKLMGADLVETDLREADLSGADLHLVYWHVSGEELGQELDEEANFTGAKYNNTTRVDFDLSKVGAILED